MQDKSAATSTAWGAGEIFTVTKRGKPVAQVIPASPSPGMASLLAEGRLRGSGAWPAVPKARPLQDKGKSAAEYVSEGRADPVLDTSALIKRFIEEARSSDVPASAAGEGGTVVAAEIACVEGHSALRG